MSIPAPIRRLVLERADGACEYCGRETDALELHHRQFLSRGGKHLVVNLVALCGWGNHTGCHGYAHSGIDASIEGLAVSAWEDPALRPVCYRGKAVLLLPAWPWFEDLTVHF